MMKAVKRLFLSHVLPVLSEPRWVLAKPAFLGFDPWDT